MRGLSPLDQYYIIIFLFKYYLFVQLLLFSVCSTYGGQTFHSIGEHPCQIKCIDIFNNNYVILTKHINTCNYIRFKSRCDCFDGKF